MTTSSSAVELCPFAQAVGTATGENPAYVCGIMLRHDEAPVRFLREDCTHHTSCSVWRHTKHKQWREPTGKV